MSYIHKVPFILSASITIIVGMIGYYQDFEPGAIYLRMSISMVIFFGLGLYLRSLIYSLNEQIKRKKDEHEAIKKREAIIGNKEEVSTDNQESRVDLRVDDSNFDDSLAAQAVMELYDEEFKPMSVKSVTLDKQDK